MTASVELKLPESVKITEDEIRMIVAARLFDLGELSSGQAAELAGITKREFIESVGRYGVSIFQYSAEELERDLARI
jgi:predicted HTH domain antitoxin